MFEALYVVDFPSVKSIELVFASPKTLSRALLALAVDPLAADLRSVAPAVRPLPVDSATVNFPIELAVKVSLVCQSPV